MSTFKDIGHPLEYIFLSSRLKAKIAMLNISRDTREQLYEVFGGKEKVIAMLEREKDVYIRNTNALQQALRMDGDVIPFVRIDVNRNIQERGDTLLSRLVKDKEEHHVRTLLEEGGIDVNRGNPLHYACKEGLERNVRLLVEHGANVNHRDENQRTPLMFACMPHYAEEEDGYDSEGDPQYSYTFVDKFPIVKYLVRHGANVNAEDMDGNTALMFAVEMEERPESAKYLLEHGAVPTHVNKRGQRAVDKIRTEKARRFLEL